MHKVSTDMLLKPMSYIGGSLSEWRILQQLEGRMVPQMISFEVRVHFLHSVKLLKEASELLAMRASQRVIEAGWKEAVEQIAPDRPLSRQELQTLIVYADKVVSVFVAEAAAISLMALAPGHADYAGAETPLFGQTVEDAFPSAAPEILDAGRCRAAGLWTACVMHLMRAVEPALQALAGSVEVQPDQNWNTALNQIEAKLRAMQKSTHGAEEEQWASEAVLQLRAIKNAWRNRAMHGAIRYGEDDAVRIFESVKFFMQTLALRLAE